MRKGVLRQLILSLFLISTVFTLNAQNPVIDLDVRNDFINQKSKHYQKLIAAQKQITANQDDFDVKYYSIELTPDPVALNLTGQVEVVAEVIGSSIDYMDLNFWAGMTITDIHRKDSPGTQLSYTHNNDILSIDLDSTYVEGDEVQVVVAYHGSPQNSPYGSFGFSTHNDEHIIGTLSEPYGARAWWPCKDVNTDKADSVDIRVTVPNDLIVASNGTLREKTTEGEFTTYWWHEQYPIATYLVSIAIHPYIVYYDDFLYNDNADTMKIHFYQYEDNYNNADIREGNDLIKDMLAFFSEAYGLYPFIEEKYGHADYHIGGAMEHQTCSSFAFWNESVYAHELAHQWWGDLVTCNSFHHIWLNEGFATYSEALWFEHAYPGYTASEHMMAWAYYDGPGTIFVDNPESNPGRIFHGGLSYNKGGWVMHMLRHVVGNENFFDILKTYGSSPEYRFGSATTQEFQSVCEEVSGMKLDKFFHQWIYEEYFPVYEYGWTFKELEGVYEIALQINQIQDNTGLYWMPIDVRISTSQYDTIFVVYDSLQSQSFEFFIDDVPLNLDIDSDDWILKDSEKILLPPYAENVHLNNTYQSPARDTLIFTCETVNPDNDNLELIASIESVDGTIADKVQMFDDGLSGDLLAADGIFGGSWPVPAGERSYNIHIVTESQESGFANMTQNAALFTSTGPVRLSNFVISSDDTIANPDDRLRFDFTLENIGLTDSVYNINANARSLDSCARVIAFSNPQFGDLGPGEEAIGSRPMSIYFDQGCEAPVELSFEIMIFSDEYLFWRDTFFVNLVTGIARQNSTLPKEFAIEQNYPNPFNPTTIINYELPITNYVELNIYNVIGQKVATLVSQQINAGYHQVEWVASGFSSGVYYYQIKAGDFQQVRKMILLR